MTELKALLDKINNKKILIYGAHQIAKDFYKYLCIHNIGDRVVGFAVTSKNGNPEDIDGLVVKTIDKYIYEKDDLIVYIATPERFFDDINDALIKNGFCNVEKLGVRGISKLENEDIIEFINKNYKKLVARECKNEYCCIELDIANKTRRLLCFGAYPLNDKSISILSKLNDGYDDTLIKEFNISQVHEKRRDNIKVLVVGGYKQIADLENLSSYEAPIVVGTALITDASNFNNGCLFDNSGDNISDKNKEYAEMTASYWLWKNDKSDYKGISHYRRRFLLDPSRLDEIKNGKYDAVLSTPRLILPSLRESFDANTSIHLSDFELIADVVASFHPDVREELERYFDGTFFLPTNMVIARREIFDEYCEWLFEILFEIESSDKYAILRTRNRYNAYIAEILTSFYFLSNSFKIRIGYAEYRLD